MRYVLLFLLTSIVACGDSATEPAEEQPASVGGVWSIGLQSHLSGNSSYIRDCHANGTLSLGQTGSSLQGWVRFTTRMCTGPYPSAWAFPFPADDTVRSGSVNGEEVAFATSNCSYSGRLTEGILSGTLTCPISGAAGGTADAGAWQALRQ
jgi:hypothetical protein